MSVYIIIQYFITKKIKYTNFSKIYIRKKEKILNIKNKNANKNRIQNRSIK